MFGEPTGSGSVKSDIITVVGGKWTKRVPEGTPNSTTRTNKAGNQVTEVSTSAVGGWIKGFGYRDTDHGRNANLTLVDPESGEEMILSFSLEDRNLFDIIKYLPNIDMSQKVRLEFRLDKDRSSATGKHCVFLVVMQGKEYIKKAYTKTNPNGMPEAKQGPRGWDFRDQEDWLLMKLEETFANFTPSLPAPAQSAAIDTVTEVLGGQVVPEGEFDNSIPF